jgi:hypothetical protein
MPGVAAVLHGTRKRIEPWIEPFKEVELWQTNCRKWKKRIGKKKVMRTSSRFLFVQLLQVLSTPERMMMESLVTTGDPASDRLLITRGGLYRR